jgi:hypothetical protein
MKYDYIEITNKWNKLDWFLDKENRFPSISGNQEEKKLAEFVAYLEQQKEKQVNDYPNDSNGTISYFLIKGYNMKLDKFQTTFSENAKSENQKSNSTEPNIGKFEDPNKSNPTDNHSIGDEQTKQQVQNNKFELDKFLDELNVNSLSAFSPELNFIEDENGEYRLKQSQIDNLQRISLLQDYIDKKEYISSQSYKESEDLMILELDILIQKNLFESETNLNKEDNLYKYWDEGGLFDRKWKDPSNPNAEADYFMNYNLKASLDNDEENSIPGFMLLGFDVNDDFIPILTLEENKELASKVFSFAYSFQRDVVFFVSSKKIFLLRYGSRSEYPIIEADYIFEDFMDFLNTSVDDIEYETSYASEKLKQFYKELNRKFQ